MTEIIKPHLNFTLICDDVRQETGGKISLMGLFENLYAMSFPVVHPRLVILNEWTEGRGEFETRTEIRSSDRNDAIRATSSRIKLKDVNVRHRDVSIHFNIEFSEPGTYWIDCYLDGELVNSMPLKVILIKGPSIH